ncbi:MAG: hypothetical protein R2705_21910 [Ilumatobacteraceae bacterium]
MATTTIKVRCRRIAESLVWIERVLNTTTWRCIDSDEPMRWWLAVSAGVEDFYDLPSAVAALRDHARAPSSVRAAWTLDWEVDGEPMAMATVSGTLRSALGARSVLQFATEDPTLATVLGPRFARICRPFPAELRAVVAVRGDLDTGADVLPDRPAGSTAHIASRLPSGRPGLNHSGSCRG